MEGKEIKTDELEALFSKIEHQAGHCPEWAKKLAIAYNSQLQSELEKAKELIERLKNDFAKYSWTEETYKAIDTFLEGSGNKTK